MPRVDVDFRSARNKDQRTIEDLRAALKRMTDHYVQQAGSGDCGFWGPEEKEEVIAARTTLKQKKRIFVDGWPG